MVEGRVPDGVELRVELRVEPEEGRRFAGRVPENAVAVILAADVTSVFSSSGSVNTLLRSVIKAMPDHDKQRRKAGQGDGADRLELACSPRSVLRRRVIARAFGGKETAARTSRGAMHNLTVSRRVILDAGHFVKEEHPLVTTGAYGLVRNPMYLGIILIWSGLGVAFQNRILRLACAAYVVPVMWFYVRAEERMMTSEFGAQFDEHASRVGRLLPRLRRRAA